MRMNALIFLPYLFIASVFSCSKKPQAISHDEKNDADSKNVDSLSEITTPPAIVARDFGISQLEASLNERPKPLANDFHYDRFLNKCVNNQGQVGRNAGFVGECGDLRGVDLTGKDLKNLNLRGADFSEAVLKGADFSGSDLRGADLLYSNWRGANVCWFCEWTRT